MIGVSLATAMIFGVLAAINVAQRAIAANFADAGEAFMIVPLAAVLSFAVLVIAAMVNVRRSDWHESLLISATAVILDAPIARPFIAYIVMGGHLPPLEGHCGTCRTARAAAARSWGSAAPHSSVNSSLLPA